MPFDFGPPPQSVPGSLMMNYCNNNTFDYDNRNSQGTVDVFYFNGIFCERLPMANVDILFCAIFSGIECMNCDLLIGEEMAYKVLKNEAAREKYRQFLFNDEVKVIE